MAHCQSAKSWKSKQVLLVLTALFATCFSAGLSAKDRDPDSAGPGITDLGAALELKSGIPKIDQTTIQPKVPLKGSVQHVDRRNAKKLSSGVAHEADKKKVKSGIKVDMLNATIQRGIGVIGIKFSSTPYRPPVIERVFSGTPASDSHLAVFDVIAAVDGVPTLGLSKEEVFNLIAGTPNTPVTLSLMHQGEIVVKTMTRIDFNDIPDPLVRRSYLGSLSQ